MTGNWIKLEDGSSLNLNGILSIRSTDCGSYICMYDDGMEYKITASDYANIVARITA